MALETSRPNVGPIVANWQSADGKLASAVRPGLEESPCLEICDRDGRSRYGGASRIGDRTLNASSIRLSGDDLHQKQERAQS